MRAFASFEAGKSVFVSNWFVACTAASCSSMFVTLLHSICCTSCVFLLCVCFLFYFFAITIFFWLPLFLFFLRVAWRVDLAVISPILVIFFIDPRFFLHLAKNAIDLTDSSVDACRGQVLQCRWTRFVLSHVHDIGIVILNLFYMPFGEDQLHPLILTNHSCFQHQLTTVSSDIVPIERLWSADCIQRV